MKINVLSRSTRRWFAAIAGGALFGMAASAADYPGWIKIEIYTPINGGVAGVKERIRTNNFPDLVTFVDRLYWSRSPAADNYGARLSGFITPTETADYVFFCASDDNMDLYLSTDSTAANLKLIAADQGWQDSRTWTGPGGASSGAGTTDVVMRRGYKPSNDVLAGNNYQWVGPFENRSDQFLNSPRTNLLTSTAEAYPGTALSAPWPNKDASGNAVIHLTANTKYYFEVIYNEGTGGENTGVAWKKVSDPDPENGVTDSEILGQYLSVDYGTSITFFTQPQSQTVSKNQPVSFTVYVVGVPGDSDQTTFTYEWLVNGTPVTDQPNLPTYSILAPTLADSGKKFSCKVTTAGGLSATSTQATLTVTDDTTPPTISKVHSSDSMVSAIVTFSEAVQTSAADPANYVFGGGLTVSDAFFGIVVDDTANPEDPKNPTNPANRKQVILLTSKQTTNTVYDLTINNIKDITGNAMTAKTTKLYANVFQAGQLNYKRWERGNSPTWSTPNVMINDPLGVDNALRYAFPTLEDSRTSGSTGGFYAGTYVDRISGFFIPDRTTNYVFLMSADNDGYLYLSTDSDPVHRKMIAADVGWQNTSEWTGPGGDTTKRRGDYAGGGPFENRSDQFLTSPRATNGVGAVNGVLTADGVDPDPWPTVDANGNAVISLVQGQRYYIELWHQEGDSGRAEVTFKYSGEPDPTNGTSSRIVASYLGSLVDPIGFPPTITTSPTNIVFNNGDTLNFSVVASSPMPATYQWYKNQGALAGRTNTLLTIPNASLVDIGSYFCAVTSVNGSVNSGPGSATPSTAVPAPQKTFQQDASGLTSIEAEHYYDAVAGADGHQWLPVTGRPDDSGGSAMSPLPDTGANYGSTDMNAITNGPRLNFKVKFNAAGTNYLWIRGGDAFGAGNGDSVHAGIDGALTVNQITGTPGFTVFPGLNWVGNINGDTRAFVVVPSAGVHTITLFMREDGFTADKIVLATDSAFTPTGTGPAESQLATSGPTISIAKNASGAWVITYTGTLVSSGTPNGTYAPVSGASGGSYTVNTQTGQQFYRSQQ